MIKVICFSIVLYIVAKIFSKRKKCPECNKGMYTMYYNNTLQRFDKECTCGYKDNYLN